MASFENFIGGGAEPDRMFPMQASNSQFDVSSLGLTERKEPVSGSHKMAGQAMIKETMDQFGSGFLEETNPVVDLATGTGELRKFDFADAVNKAIHKKIKRILLPSLALALADLRQCCIELESVLQRQNTTLCRSQLPDQMCLPFPESIPRSNTQAKPKPIPDPQGQTNRSINQEPPHEVKTNKGQRNRKLRVIQPGLIDEVPVDQHDGPSVPLLTGITPTPVSRGRGSHAVEAQVSYFTDSSFCPRSLDGRVWGKCDLCCCSIV